MDVKWKLSYQRILELNIISGHTDDTDNCACQYGELNVQLYAE